MPREGPPSPAAAAILILPNALNVHKGSCLCRYIIDIPANKILVVGLINPTATFSKVSAFFK